MCTVTEEMVLQANKRLAQQMERGMHKHTVPQGGIYMPVKVFGITTVRIITMQQVNEIYGEARKKVIESHGTKI